MPYPWRSVSRDQTLHAELKSTLKIHPAVELTVMLPESFVKISQSQTFPSTQFFIPLFCPQVVIPKALTNAPPTC